ncbi:MULTISPECIES: TetR/AcrR family transcriptional regulator [Kocuria]|uniref:Transcriptional regulator n=1 Tax=Kocuria rosea subsp. polaris TaxID=136273 RepID=A0A0A6VVQ8_KOCRO|nr:MULTISPECIES: TetR/AcrR family transcriptional regulator [Kocuria]MCC5782482.1 TetR/AcrR family transcriptional regulator [Kocuria sp. CCUG 69068]NVC22507.1 TetR/AcrR family transcriptional regulator [Kocuria salina]EYT55653.1 transcriptional regulator [Kocuria sp. UCD-OTCP]KHD98233.1 transcriptional regulator [Kocuria polaris]MCM3486588.1 TetR/AcrR family transcriptional regulator [Kocuria rosea]
MTTVPRLPARTRLLQAADRVLFDRGIRATPVDELLREAEVSAATLYTHFGSKDALVAEALRVRLADWRSVWDQHVVAAADDTARLLAVFDALASYRRDQPHPARWCAFLAAATELPEAADEIGAVLAADTALLTERLLHLSRPLAGGRAQDLADEVLLAYGGTLAAFLRGTPRSPIEVGRRLASAAVRAHRRA